MKIQISKAQRIFDTCNIILMLVLAVVMVYPIWYVICASFSISDRLLSHGGMLLIPDGFTFASYKAVFSHPQILKSYMNTIIIVVSGVVINIIMTSMMAYSLSQKNVFWSGIVMRLVTVSMFISGGLIPTYLLVSRTLHMNNSFLALILPGAISTYNLIIMRTSFQAIPDSLIESARLDGASHLRVLVRIVVPLSKAIIAVMVLYYAVGHWNSWFNASIYIQNDRDKYPLQLVLREILLQNDTSSMSQDSMLADQYSIGETIKYATIVVATIPILCVYPFLQKYFTKGVMIGAVKG